MAGIHAKTAGNYYYAEDYNDSLNFILDSMLRLGMDTGSFASQQDAHFDLFTTATAGSISNMTHGTGSYKCNNANPLLCTIRTADIPINYSTAGSQLVSFWPFDKYTLGSDVVGSNHGSVVSVSHGAGKLGSAYNWALTVGGAGLGSKIVVSDDPTLNFGTGNFTLMCWIYTPSKSSGSLWASVPSARALINKNNNTIVMVFDVGSGAGNYCLGVDKYGDVFGIVEGQSFYGSFISTGSLLSGNAWHHVVMTYDNSIGGSIFVNGSHSAVPSFDSTGGSHSNTYDFSIGNVAAQDGLGGNYSGSIDEVGVWNRALTPAEISYIYNSGRGTDNRDYTGSVTTAIVKWTGSFSSNTTTANYISLDNGTTWTEVSQGQMGSITPSTGSLMSELRITRAGSSVADTVTSVGIYYG
ncbi:MAG: LamG domain-containing protein [bacterium]|nr:LamG domain-containing protein [bacterium]